MADLSGFFGGLTDLAGAILPALERYGVLTPTAPDPNVYMQPWPPAPRTPPMTTWNPPRRMPGGALPVQQAGFELPFIDLAPGGSMSGQGGTCIGPGPMRMGGASYPNTVQFMTTTPSGNTRCMTYKNKGRALLYADDLQACKRVKRVAARARRASGGR